MAVSAQNKSGVRPNIIPLSLTQPYEKSKRDSDEIRQNIQEWLYDYYCGEYSRMIFWLEEVITDVLGEEIVEDQEWLYEFRNITKKMIDRMAVVYKEPATRTIKDEIAEDEKPITEYLDFILPTDVNSKDKRAHRFAKLFNTSLTQVYFNKDTGKVDFRVEPSHKIKIKTEDDNPYKIKEVSYRKYFKNSAGQEELYTVVWTKDEHYKEDALGNKSAIGDNEGLENPWKNEKGEGVLPFPELCIEQGEDFWGHGQADIVNLNEAVNFLLTYQLNDSVVLGTGGIPLFINTELEKNAEKKGENKKVRVGRRHPIVIDDAHSTDKVPPSVSFVSTTPAIIEIQNTIDYRIKQLAVIKGLNPNTIISEIKDTSDFQKQADSLEMLEVRRDDIDPCRNYEMKRWEVIKAVNNTAYKDSELRSKFKLQEIPWDAELKIDFAEIKQEMTPEQTWADRKEREQRNMNTPIDWMLQEDPELTEEEAEAKLRENKEINQGVGGQRVPSFLETLNLNESNQTTNEEQVNE